MKKILIFLFISVTVTAQKKVHDYKYIIVPKKFDIFNEPDKYQTSSLTKFLFNKNGFIAFLSDEEEIPNDLAKNKCKALTVDLIDGSGMLSTKAGIVLKDCYNKIVYRANDGKSKIKSYKKAYHEVIRKSFNSIKGLNYKYIPLNEDESKEAVEVVDKIKIETPDIKQKNKTSTNIEKENVLFDLFASFSNTGFILKDGSNNVYFEILRTSNPEIFIIKDRNGVFIKKGDTWMAQYYTDNKLTMKPYKVKFN